MTAVPMSYRSVQDDEFVQFRPSVAGAARWWRRVAASLIDTVIAAALFRFLFEVDVWTVIADTSAAQALPPADPLSAGIWLGFVATMPLMQAYLGSTLGKLVVGIVVVGVRSQRPVGLIRTLVRNIAHVLDQILLIGYLRPLWNANRQTFADSLLSTVVLHTRRPLAHRWLRRLAGEHGHSAIPVYNEAPRRSIGRLILTLAAVALSIASAGYLAVTSAPWEYWTLP